MKFLNKCNDFLGSKVHKNLYINPDNVNKEQTVFFPLLMNKYS